MIVAIQGKPGAGKSYESVEIVRRALEQGRPVLTNLPLVAERWAAYLPEAGNGLLRVIEGKDTFSSALQWEPAWAVDPVDKDVFVDRGFWPWRRKEKVKTVKVGAVLVIDEAGNAFSAMSKSDAAEVQRMLAVHRHHLLDVYFLIQTHTVLPVEVKHLVDEWRELSTLKRVGVKGYVARTYHHWYGSARSAVHQVTRRYKAEVFSTYDSHALGTGAGAEQDEETTGFRRLPIYFRPGFLMFYAGVVGAAIFIPLVWSGISGVTSLEGDEPAAFGSSIDSADSSDADGATAPSAPAAAAPSAAGGPVEWTDVTGDPPANVALPPTSTPVLGVVGGVVVWDDGTTRDRQELWTSGAVVVEVLGCTVVMEGLDWRSRWRCADPGG